MKFCWALGLAAAFGIFSAPGAAVAQQQKINLCSKGTGEARVAACTDLIKRGGKDAETYYFFRSVARHELGECALALEDAEKALSLKRDGENLTQVAVMLYNCDYDPERALTAFNDAIRVLPKADSYSARGALYAKKAEFELALKDYNQAIKLNPRDGDYYYQRGMLWADQEDFDKAIADYNQAIKLKPKSAAAYSYRAVAFSMKGEDAKSLADHDRAIALDPSNADLYDNRAAFHRANKDFDRALADSDKAIALAKNSSNYLGRSRTWLAKGDLDKALADADEAVRLEKGTVWSRLRRGVIYRYRGEYDRAIADFDELLRQSPFDAESYVERGRAYEKKGDLARAKADFERALKERGTLFRTAHDDARAQLAALEAAAAAPPPAAKPQAIAAVPAAAPAAAPAAPVAAAASVIRADPGRRVALVIGNSEYRHSPKLANPARDAQAVAASLRKIGFQTVVVGNDLTREKLIDSLRSFVREAEKADWAMVYYAGHGLEVGGVNYLIPVDAKLETDRDVPLEAVSLEQVLSAVEAARKIKLIVLDACRDNPFAAQMRRTLATRSVGRGLSRIEPEGATLVVYAAKHGQTALDG